LEARRRRVVREHLSGNLASPGSGHVLERFLCEHFADGKLERCTPTIALNDKVMEEDEAVRLAADLVGALR
jgi:hypothetical protein